MNETKSDLREKLKEKLVETGISVHALEKQAGLKRSAIQNILHGKSKKPSAEILYAITKVLGCSMQDLLGRNDSGTHTIFSQPKPLISSPASHSDEHLDLDLYTKAVKAASDILKSQHINLSQTFALNYIQEIYQYSLNSKQEDIDLRFAEWLASRLVSNNN